MSLLMANWARRNVQVSIYSGIQKDPSQTFLEEHLRKVRMMQKSNWASKIKY
jgi:hypothetical protein